MQVQVNTSNGIENKDALERWASAELKETLSRFKDDVTRIEVHLSDENSEKSGGNKRCMMEARLAHHQPIAVNHHAPSMDEAFRVATSKLKRALENTLGRLRDRRDHASIRKDGVVDVEPA
ncbi:HPF/RaiA family ribosome-associated protein [Polaromonas sp.]|uniref:HPF/RaiA family ribosome-associated protein n=1 Tax=Polaromonas sp. TaxID=1869339 RepID=UPI002FC9C7A1